MRKSDRTPSSPRRSGFITKRSSGSPDRATELSGHLIGAVIRARQRRAELSTGVHAVPATARHKRAHPPSMKPTQPNLAAPSRLLRERRKTRAHQLYRAPRRRLCQVRTCTLQGVNGAEDLDRVRPLGDEELIGLAAQLDPAAFEVLYQRHHVPAFSLAARIVGSAEQAQDVVREAFLILWRDAGRYDPMRGTVRRWLMIMVHDRSIEAVRRLSRRDRLPPGPARPLPQPAASELSERAALAQTPAIRDALQALPEDQLRIVELAFYEGWTQGEIAEMLELPLSTVKSRARLGLLKLREAMLRQLQAPP